MKEVKYILIMSAAIFSLYFFYGKYINFIIAVMAFGVSYLSLKLSAKFGIKESYGKIFLSTGIGFAMWGLGCIFSSYSKQIDDLLTFLGYTATILSILILISVSDKKAPRRDGIFFLTPFLIASFILIVYSQQNLQLSLLVYQILATFLASVMLYTIKVYEIGRLSKGMYLLVVGGTVICFYYLLHSVFIWKHIEFLRISAWCCGLFGIHRISKDLYID